MAAGAGGTTRPSVEAGVEEYFSTAQWLGPLSPRAPLLCIRELRYSWRRRARSGVTVEEVDSRPWLRPDLARVLTVYNVAGPEEASSVPHRLMV